MEEINFQLNGLIVPGEDTGKFEGPLTLILMLLSKNKIEIQNIEISEICKQYLEHIEEQVKEGLELKSEFVQMASYLVYLKSKSLLVTEEEISELDELIATLEKQKNKLLLEEIQTKLNFFEARCEYGRRAYTRETEISRRNICLENIRIEKDDLLYSIYKLINERPEQISLKDEHNRIAPTRIIYGVKQKISEIMYLFKNAGELLFKDVYHGAKSVSEVVATFLAVLELSAEGMLKIYIVEKDLYLAVNNDKMEEITDDVGKK